jgi:hypothetical protein
MVDRGYTLEEAYKLLHSGYGIDEGSDGEGAGSDEDDGVE